MEMYYEIEYKRIIRFNTLREAENELEKIMLEHGNDKSYDIKGRISFPNTINYQPLLKNRMTGKSYELVDGKLQEKEPYYTDGRKPIILK